jgi:hypothetical protein
MLANLDYLGRLSFCYRVRQEHLFEIEATCNCVKDEGGSLGVGLQEQASNHLKLLW